MDKKILRGISTINFYASNHNEAVEWYTKFLGIEPYFKVVGYAEFRIGDYQQELGIIDSKFSAQNINDKPTGATVYWHVDNLQDTFDKLQSLGTLDYASDPIFLADESAINTSLGGQTLPGQGGRTFTDKSINGQSYTLTVTESGSSYLYDYGTVLNRKISLYSLSKSYYQYLTSILKTNEDNAMQKLSDFGLAEPIRIFSNIQGGTGIIGASQNDSKTIDLRKILPDHM